MKRLNKQHLHCRWSTLRCHDIEEVVRQNLASSYACEDTCRKDCTKSDLRSSSCGAKVLNDSNSLQELTVDLQCQLKDKPRKKAESTTSPACLISQVVLTGWAPLQESEFNVLNQEVAPLDLIHHHATLEDSAMHIQGSDAIKPLNQESITLETVSRDAALQGSATKSAPRSLVEVAHEVAPSLNVDAVKHTENMVRKVRTNSYGRFHEPAEVVLGSWLSNSVGKVPFYNRVVPHVMRQPRCAGRATLARRSNLLSATYLVETCQKVAPFDFYSDLYIKGCREPKAGICN